MIGRRGLLGMIGAGTAGAVGLFAQPRAARAATLPAPKGKVILTISGKIRNTNKDGRALLDLDMIQGLGMTTLQTVTPWYTGPQTFEGPTMAKLLDYVGAYGTELNVIALNDYATTIPIQDFTTYPVILALKRNNEYMPIKDKGPLFVVYPFDSNADLRSQKYYSRAAWQVSQMIVK